MQSDEADRVIEHALTQGPYPGIAALVERHGKAVYRQAFGYSDIEAQTPLKPETRLPIGSITKSFTGFAAMQLVAAGKIRLDDVIACHLPRLPSPARDARIRALLNHTSGIPNYTDLGDFQRGKPVGHSREDMLAFFASKPLEFEPGTRFSYSNSGLYLIGLVIEAVSGMTYAEYVAEHIVKPFGMTHTATDAPDDGATTRARGYQPGPNGFDRAPLYDELVPFAAGAIVSSIDDLGRYARGLFGSRTSDVVRSLMFTCDRLADGTLVPYAPGCLIRTELNGHAKLTHSGDIYGFSAHFAHYPDDDLTVVVLTNAQGAGFPPLTIEHRLARIFLGEPAPTIVDEQVSESLRRTLSGTYRVGAFRFMVDQFVVAARPDGLFFGFGSADAGPLLPLRYQGASRFVSAIDDEHVFQFRVNSDGSVDLTMLYYEGTIAAHKAP